MDLGSSMTGARAEWLGELVQAVWAVLEPLAALPLLTAWRVVGSGEVDAVEAGEGNREEVHHHHRHEVHHDREPRRICWRWVTLGQHWRNWKQGN